MRDYEVQQNELIIQKFRKKNWKTYVFSFLKNLPFIFPFYKRAIYIYKKIINKLIGTEVFDRQFYEMENVFLYLSNKKKFIKETFPALNGQINRRKIFDKIFSKKIISEIYETGSYHGSTTEFLSKYKVPIQTCEISAPNYFIANDRLKKFKNIKIKNSDSYNFLKKNVSKNKKPIFFYLDAHSKDTPSPLLSELQIIFQNLENFIVVIDDFLVPHDRDYGYDSAFGSVLKVGYIKKFLNYKDTCYFFPKQKSKDESGFKRGSIFISKGNKCKALCKSINELIQY